MICLCEVIVLAHVVVNNVWQTRRLEAALEALVTDYISAQFVARQNTCA